jgi:hypothetical protein
MAEVKFEFSPPDVSNWKWKDQPPVENISPCLYVYCAPTTDNQIDGKSWSGSPLVREFLVTQNGIFRVKADSKVAEVVTEPEAKESVQLPSIEMSIMSTWYYPSGQNENGKTVQSGSRDSQVYRLVARKLDVSFSNESNEKEKQNPLRLPLIITPDSAKSPMVIQFPSDHPGLF